MYPSIKRIEIITGKRKKVKHISYLIYSKQGYCLHICGSIENALDWCNILSIPRKYVAFKYY